MHFTRDLFSKKDAPRGIPGNNFRSPGFPIPRGRGKVRGMPTPSEVFGVWRRHTQKVPRVPIHPRGSHCSGTGYVSFFAYGNVLVAPKGSHYTNLPTDCI